VDMVSLKKGTPAYELLLRKEKEQAERQSTLEIAKFAKGEGNFQLAAQNELRERGIECDDATKAQSTLQTAKFAMGEGNFQLAAQNELRERGIECEDATKAQSTLQTVKFAMGEGNLQLAAKKELRERGIECDDATKAFSINNPMKNPETAAKSATSKMGALNARYKGDKWSPDEEKQLRELCKVGYTITEIAKKMKCDVASRRTVHNKIHELQIQVNSKGKYQLLTKKY
jgi:SOS response regulatory protein OraA/RecX